MPDISSEGKAEVWGKEGASVRPGAAVTKDPKQGIKRSKFALLQFGGWKSKIKVSAGLQEHLPCLFQLLVALAPSLVATSLQSVPLSALGLSLVCF